MAMTNHNRYEIWQAKVKYEESEDAKERLVLIWNDLMLVIAYKMTGTDRGDNDEEYRIRYWKEAGLSKPTSIRLKKVIRLKQEQLLYKIGELDKRERLVLEIRLCALAQ